MNQIQAIEASMKKENVPDFRSGDGRTPKRAERRRSTTRGDKKARPAGLEPATSGFVVRDSIQLSYGRYVMLSDRGCCRAADFCRRRGNAQSSSTNLL